MATIIAPGGSFTKDPDAVLDYAVDWTKWLGEDTLVGSVWNCDDPDVALTEPGYDQAGLAWVFVSGGAQGKWYALRNRIVTAAGRTNDAVVMLYVAHVEDMSGGGLFPYMAASAAEFRADRLSQLSQYVDTSKLSDVYIHGKLRAAEADAAKRLRVFLTPTEVFPPDPTPEEIAALPLGMPWVEDAAYDYDPEFFMGESWGWIPLRHKPVSAVKSISFKYPAPTNQVFSIPASWIRVDKKYGHVRLVPASQAFAAPLSAFIMQALSGGRTVPFMIHVRYTAGLANAKADYPELIDLIKKMAALRILNDQFLPQSGSISADGLSQSVSVDTSKWQESIDHAMDDLRDQIHGIRMAVF